MHAQPGACRRRSPVTACTSSSGPQGRPAPDLERMQRPRAWCPLRRGRRGHAVVEEAGTGTVGRYRQQYVYRCPKHFVPRPGRRARLAARRRGHRLVICPAAHRRPRQAARREDAPPDRRRDRPLLVPGAPRGRRRPGLVRRQPHDNIGIVTGPDSGIFVLDVDGPTGVASIPPRRRARPPAPATRIVRTGSGGLHYFFRHPATSPSTTPPATIAKNIDIRGKGGQVVAPPSRLRQAAPTRSSPTPTSPRPPPGSSHAAGTSTPTRSSTARRPRSRAPSTSTSSCCPTGRHPPGSSSAWTRAATSTSTPRRRLLRGRLHPGPDRHHRRPLVRRRRQVRRPGRAGGARSWGKLEAESQRANEWIDGLGDRPTPPKDEPWTTIDRASRRPQPPGDVPATLGYVTPRGHDVLPAVDLSQLRLRRRPTRDELLTCRRRGPRTTSTPSSTAPTSPRPRPCSPASTAPPALPRPVHSFHGESESGKSPHRPGRMRPGPRRRRHRRLRRLRVRRRGRRRPAPRHGRHPGTP
jgi:hypothetical protein